MPEGPEVETERLHETIQEQLEEHGGAFLKRIALTTALFAALAAIASLRAGATVNHALVLKTEAARLQSEASDQWAYYQAKGIKAAVQEASMTAWTAAGKEAPGEYAENKKRYALFMDPRQMWKRGDPDNEHTPLGDLIKESE